MVSFSLRSGDEYSDFAAGRGRFQHSQAQPERVSCAPQDDAAAIEQLRAENVHLLEALSAQKKVELGLRDRLRGAEEAKAAVIEEARKTLNEASAP